MKKVVVLGAGRVAAPLIRYLLDQPDVALTVASMELDLACNLIAGRNRAKAVYLEADDSAELGRLIGEHDLAVSLLPAQFHCAVAGLCIEHGRHMVSASYVSPEMRELDGPARDAGVIILKEMGLDPGIDHMAAMRIIDDVRSRGGEVVSFESFCGGLPAPEANDNPFGYKFSWCPGAVLSACKNSARWRQEGKDTVVPGPRLFDHRAHMTIEGVGDFEAYSNRDSLVYTDIYGLPNIQTMHRGTLRHPGWCDTMGSLIDMGLLDERPLVYPAGTTYAEFAAGFLKFAQSGSLREQFASQFHLGGSSPILDRLEWLGLFGDDPISITGTETTPLKVLAARMEQRMQFQPDERDMIVLTHEFVARFPHGRGEKISATLVEYGEPNGDSAMARTVALPAAVGARLVLDGKIDRRGVFIPVTADIYNPVLDELASMGINCVEKTTPIE